MTTNVMQTPRSHGSAWDMEAPAAPESLSELLLSVGRELGLFEALVALGHVTGPALARWTGFDEGFLGEWLNAMVEMGQLEFDSVTACFAFPRHDERPVGERLPGEPS